MEHPPACTEHAARVRNGPYSKPLNLRGVCYRSTTPPFLNQTGTSRVRSQSWNWNRSVSGFKALSVPTIPIILVATF